MTNTTHSLFRENLVRRVLRGFGAGAAVAAIWLSPYASSAEEKTIAVEQQSEDSVLIATREELDKEYDAPEGSLEPISIVSDHEPEPADPPNEDAPPPGIEPNSVEVTDQGPPKAKTVQAETKAKAPSTTPGDVAAALLQEEQRVAAAPFKGIVAGQSTKKQLIELWGAATETSKSPAGQVFHYDQPNFKGIDVLIQDEKVTVIKAELEKQAQPESLAAKLRVDMLDQVEVADNKSGDVLGVAYPEKGLTLLLSNTPKGVTPIAPQFVTHIVLQAPDAEAFALRAETRPLHAYTKRLKDLSQALSINENDPYSLWLRSGVYLQTGQPVKAEADAKLALKQEEGNAAYRLRWSEALAGIGQYDDAVIEARKVIDDQNAPQIVKAQSLALMGRLASLGEADIADKSIGFHTTAIGIADKLATSKDAAERRAAKRLLIEAHLDVGIEVSRRSYNDKTEVVAQWIGRASGLAEEMISNDQGSLELRLLVARKSLEALANFKPSKNPAPWVKEANESATAIIASTDDELQKHRAHWELGQACYHALRVSHSRREADQAIAYGNNAIDHLAAGAASGDVRPEAEQIVGRLYFHVGAAYAVHKRDHKSALEWYERAQPLLLTDTPSSELVVPRQLGESLVSMGVSYWDQTQQAQAVELTVKGAEIMQRAVEAGVLDKTALGVPYGNLATMHRKLGDAAQSAKFAELAAAARSDKSGRPAVANQRGKQRPADSHAGNRTAKRQSRSRSTGQTQRRKSQPNRGTIVR